LKVLLADDNQERADAVARRLSDAGIVEIVRVEPGQRLIDIVEAAKPDVLIVDMSRPDRDSLESIREVSAQAPIVLFVDRDDPGFMQDAIDAGVSSYNLMGSSIPDVKPIAQAAVAIFRRYRKVAEDLEKAENKLGERDIVQKAKARLMKERGMTEPQAHKYLRQTAMNQGKRIVDIAWNLLGGAGKES
jgi:response regulator NasT